MLIGFERHLTPIVYTIGTILYRSLYYIKINNKSNKKSIVVLRGKENHPVIIRGLNKVIYKNILKAAINFNSIN